MGSKLRQKLHVQLLAYTLLQPKTPQWDIVLDLTSLAYQPQSCERSSHPKRHVSALSEQKSAYLAHTRELDEDEDDKRLVRPDRPTVSADEDDKPLVQTASRKELVEEKRESTAHRRVPALVRRGKGPPVLRDPSTNLEHDVLGDSRERSEEVSISEQKIRRWSSPQHHK